MSLTLGTRAAHVGPDPARRPRRGRPAVALAVVVLALTACTTEQDGTGTITGSGDDGNGLQFTAGGSVGDGVDDVEITVDTSAVDGTAPITTTSIVPWRQTTSAFGLETPKTVTMTVRSLADDGRAVCEITWSGTSIRNEETGDHAVAECVATLAYPGADG